MVYAAFWQLESPDAALAAARFEAFTQPVEVLMIRIVIRDSSSRVSECPIYIQYIRP